MEKNEIIQLHIEDLTDDGNGIGHANGMAVFVKDTVPGDEAEIKIIKVKKRYAFGRLMNLIKESEARMEPACMMARPCGGCTIMQMNYPSQLEFKQRKVLNCLTRIGGIENAADLFEEMIGMDSPFAYRNKMQFPIGLDKEGQITAGFYAGRTHSIIPMTKCAIGHPVNEKILAVVKDFCEKNGVKPYDEETGRGVIRHVLTRVGFHSKELMVCIVVNAKKLKDADRMVGPIEEAAAEFGLTFKSFTYNVNMERTNRILGFECHTIFGQDYIEDQIRDINFRISPLSFFQVNPVQTEKLYGRALEYAGLTGKERVWDLYCGIGTISLFLAKECKHVYGVEIVPEAIEDAKQNAKLNGFGNAEFFVGKAEEVVPSLYAKDKEKYQADVVVVDPPRKGCDEKLLSTIVEMAPEKVVYVSCDPATLARDLAFLTANGFALDKWSTVDMFPHSMHVETVCLLSNRKPDSYVHLNLKMEDYYRIKDAQKEQDKKEPS